MLFMLYTVTTMTHPPSRHAPSLPSSFPPPMTGPACLHAPPATFALTEAMLSLSVMVQKTLAWDANNAALRSVPRHSDTSPLFYSGLPGAPGLAFLGNIPDRSLSLRPSLKTALSFRQSFAPS